MQAMVARGWYQDIQPKQEYFEENASLLDQAILNIFILFGAAGIDIFKPFEDVQKDLYSRICNNPIDVMGNDVEAKSKLEDFYAALKMVICNQPGVFDAWKQSETSFVEYVAFQKAANQKVDYKLISIPKLLFFVYSANVGDKEVSKYIAVLKSLDVGASTYFKDLEYQIIRLVLTPSFSLNSLTQFKVPIIKQPELRPTIQYLFDATVVKLRKLNPSSIMASEYKAWLKEMEDVQGQIDFRFGKKPKEAKEKEKVQEESEESGDKGEKAYESIFDIEKEYVDEEMADGSDE